MFKVKDLQCNRLRECLCVCTMCPVGLIAITVDWFLSDQQMVKLANMDTVSLIHVVSAVDL